MSSSKEEIKKFDQLAQDWWSFDKGMKMLHLMNPVRIRFIIDSIEKNTHNFKTKNLKILDVGCGAGILTEPLSRLGHDVSGIDLSNKAIDVAKTRALEQNLQIDYKNLSIDQIDQKFDVVTALEIIEHVDDCKFFLENCLKVLKPNGLMFISTINRTYQSYAKAIGLAEYILKWVEIGTHDWNKFLKPSEIIDVISKKQSDLLDLKGMVYDPIKKSWYLSQDLSVNYIMSIIKK